MTRFLTLAIQVFTCVVLAVPAQADDSPRKLTAGERKELEAKWNDLTTAGIKAHGAGKYTDAITSFEEGLKVARRLYNATEFPDGHTNLAVTLNGLAFLYKSQGKLVAAEPLYKDALEMYKRLSKGQDHPNLVQSLNFLAALYMAQGKPNAAEPLFKDALEMQQRLFKGQDHPDLTSKLNNLAEVYEAQGKLSAAEPLYKDAVAMNQRLFKGQDHPNLALSMNNLAFLYCAQGKMGAAEPLFKDALEMRKRLFKGQDHPDLAQSLSNLAALYQAQGKLAAIEPLYKDALEMRKRLFKGQDHTDLATSLNNLAALYLDQGKLDVAEPLCKDALEMRKRLLKGQDHPDLAGSLNNLAGLYQVQGKLGAAEPFYKDALEMRKRLSKGQDHPNLGQSLYNLGFLYMAQGKQGNAEPLFKDALEMYRRLAEAFAQDKTEGETLTLLAQQPLTLDAYLSTAREDDPAEVYSQVWAAKGSIARVYERRLSQARAAAADPMAARVLADLADTRRRHADLLLATASKDPATLAQRKQDIATYENRIEKMTRELKLLLPAGVRADKLALATPSDLQKALPIDVAVVDFLRFNHIEHNKDKPGKAGETWTPHYLAFVVTKEKVARVDLDAADTIEPAVNAWRAALISDKAVPPDVAAKVRELVWQKVRKELPAVITTVYVCPDAALCQIPFAALPGDKPGTILLEDFAVATIPHAPFLLDKLWPQDERKNSPTSALVVGGVKYDVENAPPKPAPNAVASRRGDLLEKPGQMPGWGYLPNTEVEANGIVAAAGRKKLTAVRLEGDKATTSAVLEALPRSRYAHFATHGFFADPSFRTAFQLDPKDYEQSGRGERVGKAALSPLVMTGLVFAGANDPKTPGRGILTGEHLVDLDLSGLQLAVLSAGETGLGDVAGREGVFSLQRAFHLAGTRNVIAALWKVPDQSTAALMNLFYTNMWVKDLSPMESLRQAQLEIYRNPGKVPEIKPGADGKAHPVYWAAFTLSGPGR